MGTPHPETQKICSEMQSTQNRLQKMEALLAEVKASHEDLGAAFVVCQNEDRHEITEIKKMLSIFGKKFEEMTVDFEKIKKEYGQISDWAAQKNSENEQVTRELADMAHVNAEWHTHVQGNLDVIFAHQNELQENVSMLLYQMEQFSGGFQGDMHGEGGPWPEYSQETYGTPFESQGPHPEPPMANPASGRGGGVPSLPSD